MAQKRALRLKPADNVATVLEPVEAGDQVAARTGEDVVVVRALETIPVFFKLAVEYIPEGACVTKYGEPIGKASTAIAKGAMVHVHNIEGTRGRGDLAAGGKA